MACSLTKVYRKRASWIRCALFVWHLCHGLFYSRAQLTRLYTSKQHPAWRTSPTLCARILFVRLSSSQTSFSLSKSSKYVPLSPKCKKWWKNVTKAHNFFLFFPSSHLSISFSFFSSSSLVFVFFFFFTFVESFFQSHVTNH